MKTFILSLVVLGIYSVGLQPLQAGEASAPAENWVPGRLLVQPRQGLSESELTKILNQHGAAQVGKIDKIDVRIVQVQVGSEKAVEALLKHNKHLEFAERDLLLKPEQSANDPWFTTAWHLGKIGAPTAWDSSLGSNVTIAILDSGVEGSHPDLAAKMVPGWNFYNANSDTSDTCGHGTMVAGAAAAITNNSIGVASVAPGALLMPIRVTDTSCMGSLGMLAAGITWAADHGARVANLSFSKAGGYATVQNAAQYMKNKGGLVVTSSGNDYLEVTLAPSTATIVVGGTDSTDQRINWSNYGQFLDLVAPGLAIWTTKVGGGYTTPAGTSFSAPITSGVIALMMAANPALGPADLERSLFSSAVDLGTAGWDIYTGYGRVNAAGAVAAAIAATPSDTTAPSVSITSPANSSKVSGIVAVDVTAVDNVEIARVELMVGSAKIGSDSSAPYGFSWDSTTVPDGNATLTVTAYDAAGNTSFKSVTVNVSNAAAVPDTVAPVPVISSPTAGTKVGNSVTVRGSATDNVGVATLRLFIDGSQVASASGSSLSYSWNTRKVSRGTHTLLLQATDAAGNSAVQSISVTK